MAINFSGKYGKEKCILCDKCDHYICKIEGKNDLSVSVLPKEGEIARDGRFIAYANGTVLDTKTNLMWAAKDDGKGLKENDAKDYITHYRGGGYEDWRMPTVDDLETIYDWNLRNQHGLHVTKLIHITDEWVYVEGMFGSITVFNFRNSSEEPSAVGYGP